MNVNIVAEGRVGHCAPAALPRQARRAPAPASGEGEESRCSVPHLVEHRQREKVCLIVAKKWDFNILDCNIQKSPLLSMVSPSLHWRAVLRPPACVEHQDTQGVLLFRVTSCSSKIAFLK